MAKSKGKPTDKRFIDLTGKKFAHLIVLSFDGRHACPSSNSVFYWKCRCDCGQTKSVSGFHLTSGHTTSCGCQKGRFSHRLSYTKVYGIWSTMKQRCGNPKSTEYHKYGARGIRVCERWLQFENFYADMGDPPKAHSIDRRDNDGNYEPGNCRWATRITQQNNMRMNHWIEYNGKKMTSAQWSRELGIKGTTINNRVHRGFSIPEILSVTHLPPKRR